MISPAPVEVLKVEGEGDSRFIELRGVQWRIHLGILPCSASVDELRRVTADARRRYAGVRRRLLVDPQFLKDENNSPDRVMDNPLSQNPDSMWGRFFRNAELEKMVDQDLSRLYPEHGSYFQTPACQGILRRILLLWCLRHPEYGYRQGKYIINMQSHEWMHELLAPLLYVLHVDVRRLSEVRKVYEHHYNDNFDDLSFPESDLVLNYKSLKVATEIEDGNSFQRNEAKISSLNELGPEIQTIVLLTDAYGAEGELGILPSERFIEHDAYCMFDALMGGASGAVAMAEFFTPSPSIGSHTGLPPVIEASSALYHLLSLVDSSLHSHLVELGVEPQYFALRWFRVLFGREFLLEDLLSIWDEIFASDNCKLSLGAEDEESNVGVLQSPRGAFISAMAVSMLLHLRSSLLATENATSCLQRLLNFPENADVKKLIEKAKSLQSLALETSVCCPDPSPVGAFDRSKSKTARGHSLSSGSISPTTPLNLIPESYWEKKWRVLHKEEEVQRGSTGKARRHPGKRHCQREQLGSEDDFEKEEYYGLVLRRILSVKRLSAHTGSEENSRTSSSSSTMLSSRANDLENDLERSSVASSSSADENDVEPDKEELCVGMHKDPDLPVSDTISDTSDKSSADTIGKQLVGTKERKLLSGKFQWLWKFGKGGEGTFERGGNTEASRSSSIGNSQKIVPVSSTLDGCGTLPGDTADRNVMGTLKNIGQSMLENIQVIESVLQQERNQVGSVENLSKSVLVGKGQVKAVAALKELRKISNILSEM
ncbi:hypothetical protein IFM89_031516 [Coptis chinensis]|uniref:Rab-GAP TBC domain-containing protein n=1 Tax=Coptis chinensis TaxID=261450 RepID=A0A835IHN7_9MAGN|nr:hypothetical protein IFM89_031516 [Coptis chinensis]